MADLWDVLVISEVCKHWRVARGTVRYHIYRGHLAYRYTLDGKVLIDRSSVVKLWGPPGVPFDCVCYGVS